MDISFWICALVTLASALTSLGFSIAAYVKSNDNSKINAMYAASRSKAITVICVVPFFNHSSSWLIAAATMMILIQAFDAVIGATISDKLKTFGPAITALVNFATLIWFVY